MMNQEQREDRIRQIRTLAGEIGEHYHPEAHGKADAELYDFQVLVGLAHAVVHVTDFRPDKLLYWLSFCLIQLDVEIDPRIKALKNALEEEVVCQLDAQDRAE